MRVLYLSPRQCLPADSGAKLRNYHLARALGEVSELTYVHFADPGAPAQPLDFCRRTIMVPRPRRYTPFKILQGVAGRWPLPVLNYTSAEMLAAARNVLRENVFDLVHIDSIHLAACEAELRSEFGRAMTVYGWHNIESELMFRYSAATSGPRALYARLTGERLRKIEASILENAGGHIVCSQREKTVLLERAPKARVAVIENGVDTAAFKPETRQEDARRIVFVGSMNYSPNIDGAVWFVRSVWPAVLRKFPDLRFTIVGADPAPAVLALRGSPGIDVTGTVADVRPYYRDALAAVAPLRVGGGTRLKILEAMAAGVPVISSPLGAEGLEVSGGRNILMAGTEEDWVPAIESLREGTARERLGRAGWELVCSRYDWSVIGSRLVQTYVEWAGAR